MVYVQIEFKEEFYSLPTSKDGMEVRIMKKNPLVSMALMIGLSTSLIACGSNTVNQVSAQEPISSETTTTTTKEETSTTTVKVEGTTINSSELFTERDLEQEPDLTNANKISLNDNEDITIKEEGVYVVSGTAKEATITVDVLDTEKVQIVLDGASITNTDFPCIYVVNADKVFVTTTNSKNTLSVTGTFIADGETNTDAAIFSKDDLVLNGVGTLTITSSDNGIVSKDDLKVTGGTYEITCSNNALRGNDSVVIYDGKFTIDSKDDGIHAENSEDTTVGYIYLGGGEYNITAVDDAIHATTILQIEDGTYTLNAAEGLEATYIRINDGEVVINASDDGINAAKKSTISTPTIEINGGNISITMAQGDTDAIDSNGNIYVNGGAITISAQFAFDYDGMAEFNGGTITVNGNEITTISNSMMGGFEQGGMMQGQGMTPGGMPPQGHGGFTGKPGH